MIGRETRMLLRHCFAQGMSKAWARRIWRSAWRPLRPKAGARSSSEPSPTWSTPWEEAKAAGRLNRRLKTLTRSALLGVDEIGYLPVTHSGASLFFQLINRRYGRASTVLTSNKGFEESGCTLGDEVMAAALLDRLLHRRRIVNIRDRTTSRSG